MHLMGGNSTIYSEESMEDGTPRSLNQPEGSSYNQARGAAIRKHEEHPKVSGNDPSSGSQSQG